MNRTSYLRGKLLVPVIALAGYVSPSVAAVTGELSVDGRVLTVEVAESETFDPALVADTVETMVKTGSGTLTVSSDLSSWKGAIKVSDGVYRATLPAALGDVTSGQGGAVEVEDGATLELIGDGSRFSMPKKSFVIGGSGVSGRGAVVYGGSGAFDKASLGNDISLSSDALVTVEGDFHVYWNNSPTYIRVNGHTLTLKPYKSRQFILAYANTPSPQGGGIVVDGNILSLMNPYAAVAGDGTVTVANSATLDLATLSGNFDWRLDVSEGCALRTRAQVDAGQVHTNINVVGGPVSLPSGTVPLKFVYNNREGGTVSFRGKVSGADFPSPRIAGSSMRSCIFSIQTTTSPAASRRRPASTSISGATAPCRRMAVRSCSTTANFS